MGYGPWGYNELDTTEQLSTLCEGKCFGLLGIFHLLFQMQVSLRFGHQENAVDTLFWRMMRN